MKNQKKFAVIGVGSPIVDYLAAVDDAFLGTYVRGDKGGMEMVNSGEMAEIFAHLPAGYTRALGGAAANTTRALGLLGQTVAVLGKLGNDENAAYYESAMVAAGVDGSRFKHSREFPNARCLSLVTPDAERTMRTDLGAAATLLGNEVSAADFADAEYVYIEGYLLFNQELAEHVFATAKNAGCKICLNFGSFEVVRALLPQLRIWLEKYVDVVFANTDEAREFTGMIAGDAETLALSLAKSCAVAAVTDGAAGACVAFVRESGDTATVRAAALPPAALVDTTGAGDFWAAGFLYGKIRGADPAACAGIGAILSREIIAVTGVELSETVWEKIKREVANIC